MTFEQFQMLFVYWPWFGTPKPRSGFFLLLRGRHSARDEPRGGLFSRAKPIWPGRLHLCQLGKCARWYLISGYSFYLMQWTPLSGYVKNNLQWFFFTDSTKCNYNLVYNFSTLSKNWSVRILLYLSDNFYLLSIRTKLVLSMSESFGKCHHFFKQFKE